jgi:hypothetical protein
MSDDESARVNNLHDARREESVWFVSMKTEPTKPPEHVPTGESRPPFTRDEVQAPVGQAAGASQVSITTVAAWAGTSTLDAPEEYVAFAKGLGIDRLDLMLNDFSKTKVCQRFESHDEAKIRRVAKECDDAGIELHFTSWILPCVDFIDEAADALLPLMEELHVRSLVWDVEEPWTQNAEGSHGDAAARVRERFQGTRMGITGIVYVNVSAVRPLANVVTDFIPQAYATTSNGHDPAWLVDEALEEWNEGFGRMPQLMGLAAYDQGSPPSTKMQSAIDAVDARGISTICYWSLAQIKSSSAIADFIKAIPRCPGTTPPNEPLPAAGGVMVPQDWRHLASSQYDPQVALVQGLLLSWGYGPTGLVGSDGRPDGKAGSATRGALASFKQRFQLQSPADVVCGATWHWLLQSPRG